MPDSALTNSRIEAHYREHTPGSAKLAERAAASFPSGITHDSRFLEPYGLYIDRANGPRKWDVDGNEYVDYFGGHGALLLGHNNPVVASAVQDAYAKGTHFGASHALEIEWAEIVRQMVPCAQKVRFTSSGTEATLMAVRLARAYTTRPKILRFRTHFHGWNDHMAPGQANHFDGTATAGVLTGVADGVILVDPNDRDGVAAALAGGDIAGVILEPTGASTCMIPAAPGFLEYLREATSAAGALLIFDEVVTGFRVSPAAPRRRLGSRQTLQHSRRLLQAACPAAPLSARRTFLTCLDFLESPCWRLREDRPPRHVQCQPRSGRGWHRRAHHHRRNRCLRESKRLWRCHARWLEHSHPRGWHPLGCIWRIFRRPRLHRPGRPGRHLPRQF